VSVANIKADGYGQTGETNLDLTIRFQASRRIGLDVFNLGDAQQWQQQVQQSNQHHYLIGANG
jgi:hypothetical protein